MGWNLIELRHVQRALRRKLTSSMRELHAIHPPIGKSTSFRTRSAPHVCLLTLDMLQGIMFMHVSASPQHGRIHCTGKTPGGISRSTATSHTIGL